MKKNNKGFSIIIALGLVILINLIAINILDYIIPFSKDTKNIENSVVSYYQADTAVEEALFYLNKNDFKAGLEGTNSNGTVIANNYKITASGAILPKPGEGNSSYNKDWDQISIGNPIQLEIGYNKVNFSNSSTKFAFRIPKLTSAGTLTLSGGMVLPIVNWQISSENNTLNASGTYLIYPDKICKSTENYTDCAFDINSNKGIDLDGNEITIGNYYNSNCTASGCILKFSVVNKLQTTTGINTPYLEWQFKFGGSALPPLRYSIIETSGKAYGYRKDLKVKIPQQSTNEAFDFTVFQ